jgi:hypothetical protein
MWKLCYSIILANWLQYKRCHNSISNAATIRHPNGKYSAIPTTSCRKSIAYLFLSRTCTCSREKDLQTRLILSNGKRTTAWLVTHAERICGCTRWGTRSRTYQGSVGRYEPIDWPLQGFAGSLWWECIHILPPRKRHDFILGSRQLVYPWCC